MIRFNCPNCGRPYELPDALANLPLVCKQCGERLTPPAPSPDPPVRPHRAEHGGSPAPPHRAEHGGSHVPAEAPKPIPAVPKITGAPTSAAKPLPVPPPPPAKTPVFAKPAPPPDEPDDDDVLVSKPDSTPDIDFNIGGPTAASLSDAARTRPSGLSDAHRRPPDLSNAVGPGPDSIPDLNLDLLGPLPPPPAPKPAPPPPPEAPPEEKPEPTLVPFVADLVTFALLVVVGLLLGEFLVRKPIGQVLSESGSAAKFPPVDLLLLAGPPVMFGLVYLLLGSRERTVGAWLRRRRTSA